jgi:hypothetical protein
MCAETQEGDLPFFGYLLASPGGFLRLKTPQQLILIQKEKALQGVDAQLTAARRAVRHRLAANFRAAGGIAVVEASNP